MSKKVLVWDGDETLWNGTVAEGDPISIPVEVRDVVEELYRRGVVQSIASHNLQADIDAIVHSKGLEPFMVYPQAAFGVPKSQMILRLQEELNISKLEDFVFVDDSEHNRAEVKFTLPEVTVVEPWQLPNVVEEHFSKAEYTDEDRDRVRMYKAEAARKQAGEAYGGDKIGFLRTLGMKATVRPADPNELPRIANLVGRANRLAAAAIPLSGEDLVKPVIFEKLKVLEAEDKFGKYGVSGVILVSQDIFTTIIGLLVISCRLQGKGLGSAFLGSIINANIGPGHVAQAVWKATEYNAGIKELYKWYEFSIMEHNNTVIATKLMDRYVMLPDWIEVNYHA
jgi:FkbH-like protein